MRHTRTASDDSLNKMRPGPRLATLWNGMVLMVLAASLGGCSGDGFMGTGFGGKSSESSAGSSAAPASGGPMTSMSNYFFYGSASPPPIKPPTKEERDINCPKVDVLEGTAAYRIGSSSGSATEVNYQASMGDVARECNVLGNTVTMKVGVQGRVLVGMLGKPGTYDVPLRVVVKRDKNVLYSKLTKLVVTVPANDTQATFTHVEEGISVPLTEKDPAEEYDILVGFDPKGEPKKAVKRPRKKRAG